MVREDQKKQDEEKKEGATTEEETEHWLTMSVNTYHKSTIWFVVAVALCALKGASRFAVVLAYTQVFFRALQLVAMIFQRRRVARFAYGLATIATVGMYATAALSDMISNMTSE